MVGQLGVQIGESIVAGLLSAGVVNTNDERQNSCTHTEQPSREVPQVTVHLKAEHDIFRGDGSDKCSIQEWIDKTKAFIKKQKCPTCEQADEILCRLAGKAKDVVKISLRSNHKLDVKQHPDSIYSVLLQYFSETSSCLPLADFYSTLLKPKEGAVDYWIRLNKAADLADEGLRREGRRMECIGDEVARMYVKHCPDPDLASIFKCKPVHEWSARDIQGRIDDYQREHRAYGGACLHLNNQSTVLNRAEFDLHKQSLSDTSPVSCASSIPPPVSQVVNKFEPQFVPVLKPSLTCHASCSSTPPAIVQSVQQSDGQALSCMMEMLEQLMDRV